MFFGSCNITRTVPEGDYLLDDNKLRIDNPSVSKEDLRAIIRQKPNRKILGLVRFHLAVYNFGSRGKETKFKRWLKNTVGEEPVLLDTLQTLKTTNQLRLYLNNKGFYHATVNDTTVYRKRKSYVTYSIITKKPYTINRIAYAIQDPKVNALVISDTVNSLLRSGINFDQDLIEAERERITARLKNQGFYYFFKEYIFFDADTAIGNLKTDLKLWIENPQQKMSVNNDSLINVPHRQYYLNNISIQTNFDSKVNPLELDTTYYQDYFFLHKGPLRFHKTAITNNVFLKKGDLYQTRNVEDTYKKLSELRTFKFINIQFQHPDQTKALLDCKINLTPVAKQAFTVETVGTHSSGNLGIAGNLVYQNRNTFKGAEILEIRLKGGVEAQQLVVNTEETGNDNFPFNTIEIGPEVTLNIPKFLLPFRHKISKRSSPKTSITAAYNYQQRRDYNRTIANLSFGYFWRETKFKQHILTPIDLNLVKVFKQPAFEKALAQTGDVLIRNSYSDQLIMGTKYSFVFNNQGSKKFADRFSFFRANIEMAGNTLSAMNKLLEFPQDEQGNYEIFKIKYAQYARTDFDYRRYFPLNDISTLVLRTSIGAGVPYGNSEALPFIKSFYGGGANDIRAWRARSIGPGSLPRGLRRQFEQIGDLKLVGNIEYRFDIYKLLKAALFYDFGNIWLLKEDINRPGGNFELNRFHNEIAMGTGIGLRFDFSFFIIRFDTALPVKDPSLPEGYRWLIKHPQIKDLNFNLGIGYPF